MKIRSFWFNFILAGMFLAETCLLSGCKTTEEKKKAKEASELYFHLEVNPDGSDYNAPVRIYRAKPFLVNLKKDHFLDSGAMKKAEVVDVEGGFAIKITFNPQGTSLLDSITTTYKGQRMGLLAIWSDKRWLAAPRISKRIANGVFIFTPDCTREEADRITNGLNNVIKKLGKPYVF